MNNEILATIAQGTLSGTEEEGMMTFYRIPYGTNAGRFREVGAAPTWEGTRDASKPGPVFPQNKSRLSSVLGNKPGELNQSEDAFHVNVWTPSLTGSRAVLFGFTVVLGLLAAERCRGTGVPILRKTAMWSL